MLLANFRKTSAHRTGDASAIDYIFYWHGNADLILTIIKLIEDRMNADNDILGVGVQCILLVEDSIKYYSTYLPAIYKLVLQQNSEFLKEALNEQQQMLRKRARPKILLATNYTEAVELYEKYKKNLLGVISDVGFVLHKAALASEKLDAGDYAAHQGRQPADAVSHAVLAEAWATAEELGVGFIAKYSKTLLLELSDYIGEVHLRRLRLQGPDHRRPSDGPRTCATCNIWSWRFRRCCSTTPRATGFRNGCTRAGSSRWAPPCGPPAKATSTQRTNCAPSSPGPSANTAFCKVTASWPASTRPPTTATYGSPAWATDRSAARAAASPS
ncbi:MAG: hypothetical protein ACLT1W_10030 [Alistipes onderdonkii]